MLALILLAGMQASTVPPQNQNQTNIPTVPADSGFDKNDALEMENILLKDQIIQRDQRSLRAEFQVFKAEQEKKHPGMTVGQAAKLVPKGSELGPTSPQSNAARRNIPRKLPPGVGPQNGTPMPSQSH